MYAKTFTHRTNGSLSAAGPQSGVPAPVQGRKSVLPPDEVESTVARIKHRQHKYVPPPTPSEFMDTRLADRLRARFMEKDNLMKPRELISSFHLEKGIVQSYHVYPSINSETIFELTERRRRLLHRYYQRDRQFVILYRSYDECEHYLPVSLHSSRSSASSRISKKELPSSASSSSASGPSALSSELSCSTPEISGGSDPLRQGSVSCPADDGKRKSSKIGWPWLLRIDKKKVDRSKMTAT